MLKDKTTHVSLYIHIECLNNLHLSSEQLGTKTNLTSQMERARGSIDSFIFLRK